MGALGILKRVGQRVVLTERGRALAAATQQPWYEEIKRHFFLQAVLESDGDYTLNLLRILPGTTAGDEVIREVGVRFFNEMLLFLQWKKEEVSNAISAKFIRDRAVSYLEKAERSIKYDILREAPPKPLTLNERLRQLKAARRGKTVTKLGEPTESVEHTLRPRSGWLTDLGLLKVGRDKRYELTECGSALLNEIRLYGFEVHGLLRVPFSAVVAEALGIQGVKTIEPDYFHRLAVVVYSGNAATEYGGQMEDFFKELELFFRLCRLRLFNQAEISALYEAIALNSARKGEVLSSQRFDELLEETLQNYPDRVYRVAGRRGREGYISFRR
jgi:DNA-binding PadR family transcriptional regulator